MIYIFLADGFELIEALAPLDMLSRAKVDVKTVGITGEIVRSSGGVEVKADICKGELSKDNLDMIILPGGMPGTLNLEADKTVQDYIDFCAENDKYICSICAAPSVLGHKGLLSGKTVTCYPSFSDELGTANYTAGKVEADGKFITARGAGVCVDFGLKCVECVCGKAEAERIGKSVQA